MTLNEISSNINDYSLKIDTNLENLKLLLKTLRENVIVANEEVVLKEEITDPVPTVELDANWWKKNYKTLGWKQGENGYYYVDPKTKIRYSYDPKSEKLIVYKNGKRVANTKCHLYLSGDLGSVTESVTCLNNFGGQKCSAGLKGDPGKLILCPDVHDDKQDNWKNNTYYTTLMGDALVGCAGGNKPSHTIAGFSIGAQTAMKLASSNEYSKGYDKVALINMSPGNGFHYNKEQKANLAGKTFDIVENYNNENGKGARALDYTNKQNGGPHIDKLLGIPGAKVNVFVPSVKDDPKGYVTKLVTYAEGKKGNITVTQFDVPKSELGYYTGANRYKQEKGKKIHYGSSHGYGGSHLFPAYLSGFNW